MKTETPFALAITGASGAPYALRLLEVLLAQGERVDLMISAPGQIVIAMETGLKLPGRAAEIRRLLESAPASVAELLMPETKELAE